MLDTIRNAWKVHEIRKKLFFTFFMLVIFRLGNAIPVPFINTDILATFFQSMEGNLLSLMNMMSGGALGKSTIFALSIGPYITSSIIVQLLTIAIPALEEISKEGELGQKKIQQYTKYGAVVLAILEALAITNTLFASAIVAQGFLQRASIIIVMVAGSMFLIWLGDLITEKGIGNGISMLIFAGIVSRLPQTVIAWVSGVINGAINPFVAALVVLISLFVIVGVILLNQGERRLSVQYAKRVVGRKMYGGQSTHIPIKVNMSGVMPIIFTSSLLAFPMTIANLMGTETANKVAQWLSPNGMGIGSIIVNIISVLLIIMFAYFYTAIQFNTVEYSKNLQQQGGFIPGIRPGRPTSDYMSKISNRITLIGAIALSILYVLPTILSAIFKLNISFGGTSILIVVGVVLETVKQMESMLLMRHYKGFLNN